VNILVTGGAGFIGRWTVKKLLAERHRVWILDDLSNGSLDNIKEFDNHQSLMKFVQGDIKDKNILEEVFGNKPDICYHLAASINVQDSIDDPGKTFENDVTGTFNVLEQCRKHGTKMVFMSTCMVYDRAENEKGINELHPVKPASPYAGSKIAGENLVLSYWHAYKLPVVIARPFNTYGPFQKSSGEGGVVSVFTEKKLKGKTLNIYGDGAQTRDLLYVEDCADFLVSAGCSEKANGEILNAGSGKDLSINSLAYMISGNRDQLRHVPHIHPQSEIQRLLCNYEKAEKLLNWSPRIGLQEGIEKTEAWLKTKLKNFVKN